MPPDPQRTAISPAGTVASSKRPLRSLRSGSPMGPPARAVPTRGRIKQVTSAIAAPDRKSRTWPTTLAEPLLVSVTRDASPARTSTRALAAALSLVADTRYQPGLSDGIAKEVPLTAPPSGYGAARESCRRADTLGAPSNPTRVPSIDPGEGRTRATSLCPAVTPPTIASVPELARACSA